MLTRPLLVASLILALALPAAAQDGDLPLYRQADAPVDARVEDLLARMTVPEKVGQMMQLTLQAVTHEASGAVAGPSAALDGAGQAQQYEDYDIDPAKLREALVEHHLGSMLNVVAQGYDVPTWRSIIEEIQRMATEETRLGIPILYGVDAVHGANYVNGGTLFPHNLALASAFDRDLARTAVMITARETGATGVPWNFSPVLDTGREPLWGRYYETYGEDVYVTEELGVAFVEGYQYAGADTLADWRAVAATGKHFLGYSGPDQGKDRTTAFIPERFLYEYYVTPFREAIDAGVRTIMVNSGDVNGEPAHASRRLLTDLLRGELGFEGVVVTDWEDVIKLHTVHRVAESEREATRMAVEAGIDLSMVPMELSFYDHLLSLVEEGEISEARLDESVRRLLRLKFELGLFENPYPPEVAPEAVIRTPDAQEANLAAARRSVVLLKNDTLAAGPVLPLAPSQRILVAGPTADSFVPLNGGWTYTWQGTDESYAEFYPGVPTLLEAIRQRAADVQYLPGPSLLAGDLSASDRAAMEAAAENADVIVLALGEGSYAEKPGDIYDIALPEGQQLLAEVAVASGKPVVAVLIQGRPRILESIGQAGAALTAFQPGMRGGEALAEVLYGEFNPSGRLPVSYPRSPNYILPYDHMASSMTGGQWAGDGVVGGYNPLYPFGHGLSYTRFAYRDLRVEDAEVTPGDTVRVSVTVQNTGERAGEDAVLFYVRDLYASLVPPARRLRGFERLALAPGESTTVSFTVPVRDLAFYGLDGEPVLEAGEFEEHVGDERATFVLVETP
jgi:beta-glucosidase